MGTDVPLGLLQTEVLLAALAGRLLPGVEYPCVLADLHFVVQEDGNVFILDDHVVPGVIATLAAELAEHPSDTNVRSLEARTLEEVRSYSSHGGLAFLRFRPHEPMNGDVRLVLETCHIRNPNAPIKTLGALIVIYTRDRTGWHPAEPPSQLAT